MIFLKKKIKKVEVEKSQQTTKKHEKLPSRQKVKAVGVLIGNVSTPVRRQPKMLFRIYECGSKIAKNSVFDGHLSPVNWRQMAIENSVFKDFYLRSSIVLVIFIATYPMWSHYTLEVDETFPISTYSLCYLGEVRK